MVAEVRKHKEIISELRLIGLDSAADRLSYLESLADDDPDEPPILLESLQHLALFLTSERHLGNPQIGVSPDGLLGAQWGAGNDAVVAMEFLTDGLIRFAAISAPVKCDVEKQRVSGVLGKRETLQAVQPFMPGTASH